MSKLQDRAEELGFARLISQDPKDRKWYFRFPNKIREPDGPYESREEALIDGIEYSLYETGVVTGFKLAAVLVRSNGQGEIADILVDLANKRENDTKRNIE